MEGTVQRNSFLNYDDVELVETQRLTSEPTTVGGPAQNPLRETATDGDTGKFLLEIHFPQDQRDPIVTEHMNLISCLCTLQVM